MSDFALAVSTLCCTTRSGDLARVAHACSQVRDFGFGLVAGVVRDDFQVLQSPPATGLPSPRRLCPRDGLEIAADFRIKGRLLIGGNVAGETLRIISPRFGWTNFTLISGSALWRFVASLRLAAGEGKHEEQNRVAAIQPANWQRTKRSSQTFLHEHLILFGAKG
jgi:hypothetical protein